MLLLALLLPHLLAAQQAPPAPLWSKVLGGKGADELSAIAPTPDGGCLLAGMSYSDQGADKSEPSRGKIDGWVMKLDAKGNKVWDRTLGGSDLDDARALAVLPDGSCYVALASMSPPDGDRVADPLGGLDIWLVKLSPEGLVLWDRTIGSQGDEQANTALITPDGGLLLAGYTFDQSATGHHSQPGYGVRDYWVVKLNAEGNVQWERTLGGKFGDEAKTLLKTAEGYLVGGTSASPISGNKTADQAQLQDYWLVQLDEQGNTLWQRTIGAGGQDQLEAMALWPDSTLLLAGYSNSEQGYLKDEGSRGQQDYWALRYSKAGYRLWDRTLGSPGTDLLTAALLLPDGRVVLGGYSMGEKGGEKTENGQGDWDYWLLCLDPKGYLLWNKTWGRTAGDYLTAITLTTSGHLLLAGHTESTNGHTTPPDPGDTDWWVVCLPMP